MTENTHSEFVIISTKSGGRYGSAGESRQDAIDAFRDQRKDDDIASVQDIYRPARPDRLTVILTEAVSLLSTKAELSRFNARAVSGFHAAAHALLSDATMADSFASRLQALIAEVEGN